MIKKAIVLLVIVVAALTSQGNALADAPDAPDAPVELRGKGGPVSIGDIVPVEIWIVGPDPKVGAQVFVMYEHQVLEWKETTPDTAVFETVLCGPEQWCENHPPELRVPGNADYASGTLRAEDPTGSFRIAVLRFRVLSAPASGVTEVTLSFSPERPTMVALRGEAVGGVSQNATILIQPPVCDWDTDGDNKISRLEAVVAAWGYLFFGFPSREEAVEVVQTFLLERDLSCHPSGSGG